MQNAPQIQMINQNNISSFINYLHIIRNGSPATDELRNKWNQLSNDEIRIQLNNLFDSWQIDANTRANHISNFLQQEQSTTTAANPPQQKIAEQSTTPKIKSSRNYAPIIFLIVLMPVLYIAYQYFLFKNLKPIYAITNNLSVRNENNEIIGRMDLQSPEKTDVPSYSYDDIYERDIDSSGKLKKHRKVMLCEKQFMDFLLKKQECIAYVNANYITNSQDEYEKYKTVFGQLGDADANDLELKFRKIIVGSLQFDKGNLENKYLAPTVLNQRKDLRKKFSGFIKQEIIANNSFVVVAKMSDGYYYKFFGDLATNEYAAPQRLGYVEKPITDEESLMGDYLFRYNTKEKNFSLFDKNGQDLHCSSVHDSRNIISYFMLNVEEENVEGIIDQGAELIDDVKQAIENIGDKALDAIQQ
jgi:hypothetical protein